ncbi:DUF4437 domain-containing protein [Polymorphobacter sp. PAMC 29334]|uniref:cupin domain-containing protein n=1 Tax=Polymorphobacter sp. PAMC 29334 TaxID=2862331 RepID=UPI001C66B8CA|nr:DUF4437 domain-containing protein [Polymorphobacter sp. PAMC 29334]QYE33938.1 DUF4437 domain-containing protein [Polymorphobacter sp. PAMC 29334]
MAAPVKLTPPLARISSGAMPWEMLGTHGLRRQLLGYDPATGHATSLVDIPAGWRGGGIAHFHGAFEEVYIVAGSVTLDGRNYWHAGDYFYRPAHIVHGHDERSEEGATALIRSDGPLPLNLIHDPIDPDEYPLPLMNDPRGHLKSLPVADVIGISDAAFPHGWSIRPLSADPVSGARTLIADVPVGWIGATKPLGVAWEAFVLDGQIAGATTYSAGDYSAGGPRDVPLGAVASYGGCTVLFWLFGRD